MFALFLSTALASDPRSSDPTLYQQLHIECSEAKTSAAMTALMEKQSRETGAMAELVTMLVRDYVNRVSDVVIRHQATMSAEEFKQATSAIKAVDDRLTAIGLQLVERMETSVQERTNLLGMYGPGPVPKSRRTAAADICARDRLHTQVLIRLVDPEIDLQTEQLDAIVHDLQRQAALRELPLSAP